MVLMLVSEATESAYMQISPLDFLILVSYYALTLLIDLELNFQFQYANEFAGMITCNFLSVWIYIHYANELGQFLILDWTQHCRTQMRITSFWIKYANKVGGATFNRCRIKYLILWCWLFLFYSRLNLYSLCKRVDWSVIWFQIWTGHPFAEMRSPGPLPNGPQSNV